MRFTVQGIDDKKIRRKINKGGRLLQYIFEYKTLIEKIQSPKYYIRGHIMFIYFILRLGESNKWKTIRVLKMKF